MDHQIDEQLIGALYGSAVQESDWRPALNRFCQLLDSLEAGFTMGAGGPNLSMIETTGRIINEEAAKRYVAHYGRFDPKLKILARNAPGYLFNDARHFDEQFLSRSVFYQEYSLPLGTRHTLHMMAEREVGREVYLAVMRKRRNGPYSIDEESLFRAGSTHFVRALALKEKLDALRQAGDALAALDFGVVIVDSFHRVTLVNSVAEDRLAKDGDLRMSRGVLSARLSCTDRRLKALIDSALAGDVEGGVLEIRDAKGAHVPIRVAPMPLGGRLSAHRGPAALVIIGGAKRRLSRRDLSTLYGLTETESRLALAIGEGCTLRAIAAFHRVKYSTVRSQLLSVMQKMGVHRQADVARLLLTTSASTT